MAAHLAALTNAPSEGFEARTFFRGRSRRLRRHRAWAAASSAPTAVWGRGGLIANMIAVLERRLLEESIRGLDDKPLGSAGFARRSDVAAFLSGDFDDARCSDLLAGLVWAQPAGFPNTGDTPHLRRVPPFAYSALKPIFSTNEDLAAAGAIPADATMPVPPGMVRLLGAGGDEKDGRTTDRAVRAAFVRARSSGLASPFDAIRSGGPLSGSGRGRMGMGIRPDRLAAAMLIPISTMGLRSLLHRTYPDPTRDNHTHSREN